LELPGKFFIGKCITIIFLIQVIFLAVNNGYFYFAARDPELVKRIGAATALEVRATGIQYVFAPCVAVSKCHQLLMYQIILRFYFSTVLYS